jgi:hypothetical protein
MLDAAIHYALEGYSVFPCAQKKPLTGEGGYKNATCDAATILKWWTKWPDAQVGLPTGAVNDVFVVDLDGPRGCAAVEEMGLPETLTIETRPGRFQLWFRQAEGIKTKCTASALAPELDTRGDGGYVIAPPSIHHETGKPYRIIKNLPLVDIPPALLARFSSNGSASAAATATLTDEIPEGKRNVALTSFAGRWRAQGFDRHQILALLQDLNRRRCNPPLPDQELQQVANSIGAKPTTVGDLEIEPEPEDEPARCQSPAMPDFPPEAWRGIFADYRDAMKSATEASDVFHFGALWARCATALGRRVHMNVGMRQYANVYVVCFGATGDRKTTATRRGIDLGGPCGIIRGGGSGEGLADEFQKAIPGEGLVLYAEEFSQLLRPGQWSGATLIPFLTQCFDCPDRYELKFRKKPVVLDRPTPTLLAGTTPDWFWQDFRVRDFQGGFGNRIFFLTGSRKEAMPLPEMPSLDGIATAIDWIGATEPCEARFDSNAAILWGKFYREWTAGRQSRDPLLAAATERITSYILKLAMLYAAIESTLPVIVADQLQAAILVGEYGEKSAAELLALQHAATNPRKELERRILAATTTKTTKRSIYTQLWRHYSNSEEFNKAFDSLVRAGNLFTKPGYHGRVWVARQPFD